MTAIPARIGSIVIRYLVEADHAAYIALERDADVKRYVNGPSSKTDDELLSDLRNYRPNFSVMAVADAASDAFLGRCGILPINKTNEAELFLLLARSNQRKGTGRVVLPFLIDLARSLGKTPIGIVDPQNRPSLALIEKVGMVFIGTVNSPGYQNGHLRYEPATG